MRKFNAFQLILLCFFLNAAITTNMAIAATSMAKQPAKQFRTVTDMRGKNVRIPEQLTNIATIDDGFVEGVLTNLGMIGKVNVIGSWSMKRDYRYEYEAASGEKYEHRGWNTMKFLHPWLDEKVCVNSPQGNILNFEALANAAPDVVIMRVGDCTVRAGDKAAAEKTINTIEALGLPLVVLYSPDWYKNTSLASMRTEAEIIGSLFGAENAAKGAELMDFLAETESLIKERVKGIAEKDKARILYIGLDPKVRQQGGSGRVWGAETPESYIIQHVAGAKNAFTGRGSGVPISAEQIYALDPDVIILPTYNGYHPPRELYESSYFEALKELRAVKNKKVYSMPWSPMNCARRVEYPLDLIIIAKAAYPEHFKDINVYQFALELYKRAYHVDDKTARGLRTTQLLDWMQDANF